MLKNKAVQKPDTAKPSTKESPIKIITALITNKNKPNVIMVAGIVSNTKIGFKKRFNKANTMAIIKALL